jgi:hypothetical protein
MKRKKVIQTIYLSVVSAALLIGISYTLLVLQSGKAHSDTRTYLSVSFVLLRGSSWV